MVVVLSRIANLPVRAPDHWIGFMAPLALFVEAGSPILLATSPIGREVVALPLSLLALPLAVLLALTRIPKKPSASQLRLAAVSAPFPLITLAVSSVAAVYREPVAAAFGFQWLLIFLWLAYFGTLDTRSFRAFLRGYVVGVVLVVAYYAISVALEYLLHGGLQDAGRMTQNLILPGQYQIAVYVPTLIAFSVAFVTALHLTDTIAVPRFVVLLLNLGAALVLVAMSAREALLVYGLALVAMFVLGKPMRTVFSVLVFLAAITFVSLNWQAVSESLVGSDNRTLRKIADLEASDRRLSGRDLMVSEAWAIVSANPMFGSQFVPLDRTGHDLGVTVPSAHNMYVDALAWSGFAGGAFFIAFCFFVAAMSSTIFVRSMLWTRTSKPTLLEYVSFLSLTFLLVSNNINVPMRQPVIVPTFAMLITLVVLRNVRGKS